MTGRTPDIDAIGDAVREEYRQTVGRIAYVLGLCADTATLAEVEEEVERLRGMEAALRTMVMALAYGCVECDEPAVWNAGPAWSYCDEHIEAAREADRKSRGKGNRGDTFVEVEHATNIRAACAALRGI